jgi:hypothetical protein
MNSKIRTLARVELYVDAEEIHFLAIATTAAMRNRPERFRAEMRDTTNHIQDLSMKLRAMEVAP